MEKSLLSYLESVKDSRRKAGQRYSLSTLLGIIMMTVLSGEHSIRGFERFASVNKEE